MGTVTKPFFGQLNVAQPQSWCNLVHVGVTPELATRMQSEHITTDFTRETNRILLYQHALQHPVMRFFPKITPEKVFKTDISTNQTAFIKGIEKLAVKYPPGSLNDAEPDSIYHNILTAVNGYERNSFAKLAVVFSRRGHKHVALGAFEFIAQNENDSRSYLKLAHEALYFNEPGLALNAFEKAFDLDPAQADCQFQIGLIFYKSNHMPTAIRYFLRTLALDPKHAKAWNLLVAALAQNGEVSQAIQAAKKYLASVSDPKQKSYACFALAQLYKATGKTDLAMLSYLDAHELNPESYQPIFAYVGLLMELGKADAAQKVLLHLIVDQPKKPELHLRLAKIYLETGEIEKAHTIKEVAIALSPMPLSSELKNLSKMVDAQMVPHLKLKLVQNPHDSKSRQELAEISIEFKQYQDAFTHYHVLKKIDPVRAEQVLDQLVQLPDLVDHEMYVREVRELKVRESLV